MEGCSQEIGEGGVRRKSAAVTERLSKKPTPCKHLVSTKNIKNVTASKDVVDAMLSRLCKVKRDSASKQEKSIKKINSTRLAVKKITTPLKNAKSILIKKEQNDVFTRLYPKDAIDAANKKRVERRPYGGENCNLNKMQGGVKSRFAHQERSITKQTLEGSYIKPWVGNKARTKIDKIVNAQEEKFKNNAHLSQIFSISINISKKVFQRRHKCISGKHASGIGV